MKKYPLIAAALGAAGLMAAPVMAQDAEPESPDAETSAEAPEAAPATIDTDGDGTMDAWDQRGDGKPDTWDTDGDGQPDAYDQDGDGAPDPQ